MALRIGGGKKMPPMEEEVQAATEAMPEEMAEPMPEEAPEEMPMEMSGGGTIDPAIAGYKGPEMGPFQCGHCIHFQNDGTCDIVAGPVDEAGVCNIFTPLQDEQEEEPMPEAEEPAAEPMPEEEPTE